ncbi:hypothetical protein HEQ50_04995 [Lactobacillus sp. ZJLC28-8]|nr:hypothetical protein [Lactobacillus sp. HBUAS51381]
MRQSGEIWMAVILGVILLGYLIFKIMRRIIAGPNHSYYQRTKAYAQGTIQLGLYSQSEIETLTSITHGDQYSGNTSLDEVASKHVYRMAKKNLPSVVGRDGILHLYNASTFMTTAMVKAAAKYWNLLAGELIVEVVEKHYLSDEVICDGQTPRRVLGGQTYNGRGIVFYPDNWHISHLSPENQNNWQEAVLIHEIGHVLGIPHLGGGPFGNNAINDKLATTEFMGPWSVGFAKSPRQNEYGVHSTVVDGAALALAGLSWQHPRKLANWVLTDPQATVTYNNGILKSTIS